MTPVPLPGKEKPDEGGPDSVSRVRPYLRVPVPEREPEPAGSVARDAEDPGEAGPVPAGARAVPAGLRPFVLTSGRVGVPDADIGVETQVTAREEAGEPTLALTPELRAIVTICDAPLSIAEISAHLRLHLGVTRILVSDLRAAGYVDVHPLDLSSHQDPDLIMRVIRGLRAIS